MVGSIAETISETRFAEKPPCLAAFLSILRGRSPCVPDVQAIEVLLCRNGFSAACRKTAVRLLQAAVQHSTFA